jgi:hypothetical protein
MDVFNLITDLKSCYEAKAPKVENYVKLSSRERDNLCTEVRKTLINYVNSPEYSFYNVVKVLKETSGKIYQN